MGDDHRVSEGQQVKLRASLEHHLLQKDVFAVAAGNKGRKILETQKPTASELILSINKQNSYVGHLSWLPI